MRPVRCLLALVVASVSRARCRRVGATRRAPARRRSKCSVACAPAAVARDVPAAPLRIVGSQDPVNRAAYSATGELLVARRRQPRAACSWDSSSSIRHPRWLPAIDRASRCDNRRLDAASSRSTRRPRLRGSSMFCDDHRPATTSNRSWRRRIPERHRSRCRERRTRLQRARAHPHRTPKTANSGAVGDFDV